MLGSSLTTTTIILTRPPSSPPSCLPTQTLSLPCPSPPLRDVGWCSCSSMEGYAGRSIEGGPKTWEAQHGTSKREQRRLSLLVLARPLSTYLTYAFIPNIADVAIREDETATTQRRVSPTKTPTVRQRCGSPTPAKRRPRRSGKPNPVHTNQGDDVGAQ